MITFQVNDMTCGHCASAITRAIAGIDDKARLDIRIQEKLVRVSSTASTAELAQAIQEAGYTPREIQQAPAASASTSASTSAPAPKSGCGCGCATRKAAPVDAGQPPAPARGSCCG
ncbi:heavy-metal-associated domain-containing protein [Caenimonas sp. SL110]|uniref:heavy-metal-associated domain-containing protein n=1 Tax=Caenimonas sp. SL110 TaxID=1450524 RepID=UPI0009E282A3|nr:heavy-metal-associated domain-containing protein [Caenimonas sp. SL110]